MSKGATVVATLVIAACVLAIAGLVAMSTLRPEQADFRSGGIERAVAAAEDAGLGVTAVSPVDVYGEEFVAAMIVCPGPGAAEIQEELGLPERPEGLPDHVDQGNNYLLLIRQDGSSAADHLKVNRVNLCSGQALPPFNALQLVPLAKTKEGGWILAG